MVPVVSCWVHSTSGASSVIFPLAIQVIFGAVSVIRSAASMVALYADGLKRPGSRLVFEHCTVRKSDMRRLC